MKRPNNSNIIEENEQLKQKAQFLTLHKNYKGVIECYKKIAKNFKIEEKTEKNVSAKNNLKCNLKYIKKLIKDLRTVSNSFNEILPKDIDFLFKDLQDSYYFFEDIDIKDDDFLEQDDIFECLDINVDVSFEQDDKFGIPKKNCWKEIEPIIHKWFDTNHILINGINYMKDLSDSGVSLKNDDGTTITEMQLKRFLEEKKFETSFKKDILKFYYEKMHKTQAFSCPKGFYSIFKS
ncbi:hypothetical protein LCGC14_1561120, partial [marine sediment metagenome]